MFGEDPYVTLHASSYEAGKCPAGDMFGEDPYVTVYSRNEIVEKIYELL